jgi:lipoprotein-releasing system permease protein
MSTRFEQLIGLRYLRTGGRGAQGNRFLSVISGISLGGVALGVAVLLVVLSVMNGFEDELRERILGITAHATVSGFGAPLSDWQRVRDQAEQQPGVLGAAPFIEKQAMLITVSNGKSISSGVMLRGVLPEQESKVATLSTHMKEGRLTDLHAGEYGIVLGDELAKTLNAHVGDKVVVVTAQGSVTIAGVIPRSRRFTVVGIFSVGMYEYDRNYAYLHMGDAAKLYRMGSDVTGVRLKLADIFDAKRTAVQVAQKLGGGYYVDDWTSKHANFFRSIALTKSMMFLILLLVVAVAAFNVIATLVMVVKDKQSDIAILRTLGATPHEVMKVFITQGIAIGVIGVLSGVVLGSLLAWNLESFIHGLEALFHTKFMDAKLYYMSDLPAEVQAWDVIKVSVVAFLMCALATLYPAWRAARVQPAQALRHE